MATLDESLSWAQEHIINAVYPIGQKAAVLFERGDGVMLEDALGKQYIDASSQLTCVNLGYGRRELIDAVAAEMGKVQFIKLFHGYCSSAIVECARLLAELTPGGLDRFVFTAGGSESIELAVQYARLYWHKKGRPKHKIISLFDSYHGITLGAVTASGYGKGSAWKGIGPLPSGFIHVPAFNCYYCMFGREYPNCGIQCAQFLEETIIKEGPDSIAAFLAEPVQGVGGMIVPPVEYWPMVSEICKRHEVLLIADEVMTGFCRTGKMFAVENWKVKPDLMTLAKGLTSAYLPMGAVAFGGDIFDTLRGESLAGFTYGGHPVAAAAAIQTMQIYVKEDIAQNAARMGAYVLERFSRELNNIPWVDNISGLGLMIGFNLVKDKASRTPLDAATAAGVVTQALQKGLLIRCSNPNTTTGSRVCFTPPLVIRRDEVDRAIDILVPVVAGLKPGKP